MAVMGRKKKAVAQRWNAINKTRDKAHKEKEQEKEISKEEHQERLKRLKKAGLLK